MARCRRLGALAPPDPVVATGTRRHGPAEAVLALDNVTRTFGRSRWFSRGAEVHATRGVGFAVGRAETVALVGESGSGKSTLARILVGLDTADGGTAAFGGENIAVLPAEKRPDRLIRAVQMVFQNPDGTLNPAHRVGRILARALKRARRPHGAAEVAELLALVRLGPETADRFPAQLSGGQRQRVAIARAFAGEPELILADEPVSALDVSVQAAIVTLLGEAQAERDVAILLISHDLMLVRHVADRVVVLYRGQVMEEGTADQVFARPSHPYTQALRAAVHPPDPDHAPPRLNAPDDPGPPPAEGCPFQPRCHRRFARRAAAPHAGGRRPPHPVSPRPHHACEARSRDMTREPHLRGRGPFLPPLDQVTQYPWAPGYVVFTLPCPKRVRVIANGVTVADSADVLMLFESDHIPIYYFPLADIRMDLFETGARRTECPFKGTATHYSLKGAPGYEDVLWHYAEPIPHCPDISGHASFYWHEVDRWFEEDEEVFVHARDPFRRVDTLPTSRGVKVEAAGRTIAESSRAVLLFETGLPTRHYLPLEDVDRAFLAPSDHRTQCPYKGEAQYYHLDLPGRERLENVAWYYADPLHESARIRGLVCFAGEYMDRITVAGREEPRPVTAFQRGHNYHGYKD